MHRQLLHSFPALLLTLAAGSLAAGTPAPAALRAIQAQEAQRAVRAQAHLLSLRSATGLGTQDGFQAHRPMTNAQGRTIVRFDQTYQGRRVWGSEAIAHVEAEGQVKAITKGLKQGIALAGQPRLGAAPATALALKDPSVKGTVIGTPEAETVVFPSGLTGGFATKEDQASHQPILDPEMSVFGKASSDPYRWAYEVRVRTQLSPQAMQESFLIVDGDTGAVLRKSRHIGPSSSPALASRPAQVATPDTPVVGVGNSLYSGTVSLNTTQSSADGTYTLLDTTRGSVPNPLLTSWGLEATPGLRVTYDHMDPLTVPGWILPGTYTGHASNTWGDGQAFLGGSSVPWITDPVTGEQYYQGAKDPIGETAAVDAMFGMAASWDFYKNLFNRDGMDGLGTSVLADLHSMTFDFNTGAQFDYNNGTYSLSWNSIIMLGDGTTTDPNDPTGHLPYTEVDLVAREMSSLLMDSAGVIGTQPYGAWGESLPLNTGVRSILAKMVQAYAQRPAGQDNAIPDFANAADLTQWQVGAKSGNGHPWSFMYKPSLDGHSADGWYDGIQGMYHGYGSGPIVRMFYFLSQGSSSNASSDTYSAFLPGGMTGIGNDAAGRIWFKAMTEHLLQAGTYADAREAAVLAAQELYGAGTPEETAVMNAFAAVNIGDAPGQPKRVKVTFPIVHPDGQPFTNPYSSFYPDLYAKIQIFPAGVRVKAQCAVENTANTALTWSLGVYPDDCYGYSDADAVGGVINADGTWTTPMTDNIAGGFWIIKATSQADAKQFAKGRMFVLNIDSDLDTELDAFDLGLTSMTYGLGRNNPYPYAAIYTRTGGAQDTDVAAFVEAFTNAFPAK